VPYLFSGFKELERKYGVIWQSIEQFCDSWINNACALFDELCLTLFTRMQ